jgi:hypothetical protein
MLKQEILKQLDKAKCVYDDIANAYAKIDDGDILQG